MPQWFSYDNDNSFISDWTSATEALDKCEDTLMTAAEDWEKHYEDIHEVDCEDIVSGIVLWRPAVVDIPEDEREPGNEAEDEPAGPTQRWEMVLDADAVAAVLQYATLDQLKTEMERRIKDIDVQLRAVGEE